MTVDIPLEKNVTALIIYHLNVQPTGTGLDNPLPRESVKDTIQSRVVIDGIPYRSSSSSGALYSTVNKQNVVPLTSSFVVPLLSGRHVIGVQWKKGGNHLESWFAGADNLASASSIVVHTDHERVWYRNSIADTVITSAQQNTWVAINDPSQPPLTLTLERETSVTIGYSMVVMPQLAGILKDRRMGTSPPASALTAWAI
jgi:hypothetical protein